MTIESDKLSCINRYKRSLVAPTFIEGVNRNGELIYRRHKIVDIPRSEGKEFRSIYVQNRSLPNFYKELLNIAIPGCLFELIDGSSWFNAYPGGAIDFYFDLFMGLARSAIFVEDFVTDHHEDEFFRRIVMPSFQAAERALGYRPVVSQLIPNRRVKSPLWYAYPASYRAHFAALGCTL